MFIAAATAAALAASDGLNHMFNGFCDILEALRIRMASSLAQHPLSPLDAQRLSCCLQARSNTSTALAFHEPL